MATTPQIPVHQSKVRLPKPKVRNAAIGQKPGSFYLAATRRTKDRDYEPRDDLD